MLSDTQKAIIQNLPTGNKVLLLGLLVAALKAAGERSRKLASQSHSVQKRQVTMAADAPSLPDTSGVTINQISNSLRQSGLDSNITNLLTSTLSENTPSQNQSSNPGLKTSSTSAKSSQQVTHNLNLHRWKARTLSKSSTFLTLEKAKLTDQIQMYTEWIQVLSS